MNRFQTIKVIGQGAYGIVLKCKNIQSGQIVALKKSKQTQQEQIVKKTNQRELKMLKLLRQQNIVLLKQSFKTKHGIVCLIFQYIQKNLLEIIEKYVNGLPIHLIKRIIYQILKGLSYIHSFNIIHRDIKPQNILVSQKFNVKICDFGFSRSIKQNFQQLTQYVATRWYRSPQLLIGVKYNTQIDIWSLGCIMGQLIDGNPLFPGQNEIDQLFLIQKTLGKLSPQLMQIFLKNPKFMGLQFPVINKLQTLENKYFGKLPNNGINLLKCMLKIKPQERFNALQCLQHCFFDQIRQDQFVFKLMVNKQNKLRVISASSNHMDQFSLNQSCKNKISIDQEKLNNFNVTNFKFSKVKGLEKTSYNLYKNSFLNEKQLKQKVGKSLNKAKMNIRKKQQKKYISVEKHYNKELIKQVNHDLQKKKGLQIQKECTNRIYNTKKKNSVFEKIYDKILETKRNKKINILNQQLKQNQIFQNKGQLPYLFISKFSQSANKHVNLIFNHNKYNFKH